MLLYTCSKGTERKTIGVAVCCDGRKENVIMKKFCTRCGKQFESVGREVICPSCKAQAAEDAKRAAVLKAKKASWNGESVPVRISGRASTVIRRYAAAHDVPFQEALDELLKSTQFFQSAGKAWEEVTPYRSHRRDKATSTAQGKAQDAQDGAQTAQAAKQEGKATTSRAKKDVKTAAGKTNKGGKA